LRLFLYVLIELGSLNIDVAAFVGELKVKFLGVANLYLFAVD